MSSKWVDDINMMHAKYQVHDWVRDNPEKLYEFLKFRTKFIQEELNELYIAVDGADAEEIVDALIDICVVAIGTLDAFNVDCDKAWDTVFQANIAKEVGVKSSRPNPLGLPDLIKPEGWVAPSHELNYGLFENLGETNETVA